MRCGQGLNVTYEPISSRHVEALKNLNNVIFPIKYSDRLYRDCLSCGDVTQLAFVDGQLIGAIACRLERAEGDKAVLHILTLGVLAPYRRMGVGSRLLHRALAACVDDDVIEEATLHVQVGNEEALSFYSRAGFVTRGLVKGHYPRLDPADAMHLSYSFAQRRAKAAVG